MNLIFHNMFYLAVTGNANCGDGTTCDTGLPQVGAGAVQLHEILQIILAVLGAIAVLVVVISGLRFITAQGNPQEVAKARSTLVNAVVGLVVILGAEAIVAFVLGNV